MKDRVQDFLQEYRSLELAVREKGKEVVDLEQELGVETHDPTANRLKLCRTLRNFCTHNDYEGLVQITPGLIKFVKTFTKDLKKKKVVKKKGKK